MVEKVGCWHDGGQPHDYWWGFNDGPLAYYVPALLYQIEPCFIYKHVLILPSYGIQHCIHTVNIDIATERQRHADECEINMYHNLGDAAHNTLFDL